MSQPNDYEWIRQGAWDARCYPSGPAAEGRAYLRVRARRTGIMGLSGEIILWAAWFVEPLGLPYRIEIDGRMQWGSRSEAEKAAVYWHRHTVESYDPQHDVDLQRAGYSTAEKLPDVKV